MLASSEYGILVLCWGVRVAMPIMMQPNHHPARPPTCATAPLLWGLVPLMAGILCADSREPVVSSLIVLFAIIPLTPLLWYRKTALMSCFLLGLGCHLLTHEKPHRDWHRLPQREVSMEIRVTELFNTRRQDRVSGIGIILQTNIPRDTVSAGSISFYLENPGGDSGVGMVGESFRCTGVLTYLPYLDETDGFQQYLNSRGIFMTINNGAISGLTSPAPLAERLRVAHFNRYQDILRGNTRDSSAGNVLASMLLGNRRLLSDKQIELYRNSGTYHLFAVSGLHTGCMAVFIAGTLRLLRIPDRWALPLVLAAVWYYVWLTGNSPSSVRSAIMISCLMAGRLLWRQSQPFPALVASAWIVLLIQPDQLFSLGFQLSYAVVASIILIGLPLSAFASQILSRHIQAGVPSHVRNRLLARISQSIMGVTCISLSAGCISMPLILQHFNLFTPCGVLIGIVLNPLASATIMTGCLTMLLTPMVPALASLVAMAAWPLIRVMEWLLVAATSVPGAYSTRVWIHPQMGAIVVILAIAIAWGLQYLRQQRMHGSPMTCLIPILFVAAALGFGSVDA